MPSGNITFEEYLALSELSYEWADSYDTKDWERLLKSMAPVLKIDYMLVFGQKWDAIAAEEFVAIISSADALGDPLIVTQHFLGATKWDRISADEVIGRHQIRAAHQKYSDATRKTVKTIGNGHGVVEHRYQRRGSEWKLSGIRPIVRWNEGNFDEIVSQHINSFEETKAQ